MDALTGLIPEQDELSPTVRLLLMASAVKVSRAVWALAKLDVADQLAAGPRTVAELAAATGSDATALYRLLRCAASVRVFVEREPGTFALTPMADPLRTDVPHSVRDAVVLSGEDFFWWSYGEIMHAVTTGEPAFEAAFGMSPWKYLEDHPYAGPIYDAAMSERSNRVGPLYLAQTDFGRFHRIADLGGGRGEFLVQALAMHPHCHGLLFERPPVVPAARALLAERGVADRVSVLAGDFFTDPLPAGYDAYVVKQVLSLWPDDQALALMRRVRDAIGERADARLLVLDQVVAPLNRWDVAKVVDLDMLTVFGGRERNAQEWRALVSAAGFDLVGELTGGQHNVIECRPV
jgi:multifunctional cyclase/dehydratase/O-methyltransferase